MKPTDTLSTLRVPVSPVPAPDAISTPRVPCEPAAAPPAADAGPRDNPPAAPEPDAEVITLVVPPMFERPEGDAPAKAGSSAPKRREQLAALLTRRELLDSFAAAEGDDPPRFPEVGESVFGFRLRHELGRGAFARVFLADQLALGGRAVAVKISAIEGREPQTLARMQHTHIVPIYSVEDDARAGLRAVCMPYFGGASLANVLDTLAVAQTGKQYGWELVAALERCQAPAAAAPPTDGRTPLAVLGATSYVRAVVWLVARLAEGLQHAHDRGVVHRDIKPSNILIAGDGQPMLLDFNLSQSSKDGTPAAVLGGTLAYMSPEHLRAMVTRTDTGAVNHRSDIYALGMVLFEALAGARPFETGGSYAAMPARLAAMADERGKAAPSLRAARADASWGLESIVRTCLAPDPAARYQRAEHFAEDLRAFLDDRPLRYAPELSRVERVRKWGRRNPKLTTAATISAAAVVLLSVAGAAVANLRGNLAVTQAELGSAQARDRKRDHDAGTAAALCLVNTTLDSPDHVRQGVAVCERTLGIYGGLDGERWREHPDWRSFPPDEQARLREDARELMMLLAAARVRTAPADAAVLGGALALLDRAEAVGDLPPSRALWLDRSRYLGALGEGGRAAEAARRAEQIPVSTARAHYLHATALGRAGDPAAYRRAVAELDKALALDPRYYWAWFQRGICHTGLGEFVLAAGDFGHCTGLWPDFAWGHFNQGYVFDQSGKKAEAVACYTRAAEHDPTLAVGFLNRGLARLELRQWPEALADFDRASAAGRAEPALHAGRGVALEGLGRHPEADAAFRSAFDAGAPPVARQRMQLAYGFAVDGRLPGEARRTFREVLQADPRNAQAHYGLGMLAMRDGDNAEAVRHFARAVDAAPSFLDARRYRGVALAREGSFAPASDDVNWCLEKEPQSGPSLYAAACVAALAARRVPDHTHVDQAVALLEKALANGIDPRRAAADPDLAGLQAHPRVRELLGRRR